MLEILVVLEEVFKNNELMLSSLSCILSNWLSLLYAWRVFPYLFLMVMVSELIP